MKKFLTVIALLSASSGFGQSGIQGTEFGLDGYFSASTWGGSFGVGVKYGINFGEYFIAGPSIRVERLWSKNPAAGTHGATTIYGGGAFFHARFYDALFVGTEIELLKSPTAYYLAQANSAWVPTAFIGGGFSKEFNESWRLNLGIFYDVVNSPSSPFFNSYMIVRENGSRVPLIYRLAVFIPLT